MVVGQLAEAKDLVVLGAGPGGYEAALAAAECGRRVALIDLAGDRRLGGECLHDGCIPSKALLDFAASRRLSEDGDPSDMSGFQQRRADIIEGLRSAISKRLSHANVEIIEGHGRFSKPTQVVVEAAGAQPRFMDFTTAIVATGSRAIELSALPVDGVSVIDASHALRLDRVPPTLAIVGGGYIGLELGTAFAGLGASVTILEREGRLLPGMDAEMSEAAGRIVERAGVTARTGVEVTGAADGQIEVRTDGGGSETLQASTTIVAVGRRPNTDDIGIDAARLTLTRGNQIETDDQCRATGGIFAIGDASEGPALAHRASAEAVVAAHASSGLPTSGKPIVPAVVYTDPELASVGVSLAEAADNPGDLVVARARVADTGRGVIEGDHDGFVRLVVDRHDGAVLGAHIVASHAGDLIGIATFAVEMGATVQDLSAIAFAHPTLSELLATTSRTAQRRLEARGAA